MVEKTYADDAFGSRKEFGDLLYAFLQSEHILADESFVVALTGGFGSGKSHFLSMWESEIKSKEDPKPLVVRVDAWKSDHSGEPVLAIVSAIAKQLEPLKDFDDKSLENLKSAAGRVIRGSGTLLKDAAVHLLEAKTGLKVDNALKTLTETQSEDMLNRKAMALFEDFEARQKAIDDMTTALKSLIGEYDHATGLKLILVVDELDRCRPTYAIDMLEALKHLFNVKGLGVLLSVDWDQLSCTARALFGTRLNTTEYFRKFISRKVPLPAPGEREMGKLVVKLWERFIETQHPSMTERTTSAPLLNSVGNGPVAILIGLGITRPRQLEDFFRVFSHLFHLKNGNINARQSWQSNFWAKYLLCGLCVMDPRKFDRIARGNLDVEEILGLVYSITRQGKSDYNFNLIYLESELIDHFADSSILDELKDKFMKGVPPEEMEYRKSSRTLPHFKSGYEVCPMTNLARHINTLKSFSES